MATYIYTEIIQWSIDTQTANQIFWPKIRKGFIEEIKTLLPWLKSTAPIIKETILETNTTAPQYIDGTTFDFKTQLLSLLNDKTLFGNIENLDINSNNLLENTNHLETYFLLSILEWDMNTHTRQWSKTKKMIFFYQLFLHAMKSKLQTKVRQHHAPYYSQQVFSIKKWEINQMHGTSWAIFQFKTYTSPKQEQHFSTDLKYTRMHQILKQYWNLM